jgi:hypothetical protein
MFLVPFLLNCKAGFDLLSVGKTVKGGGFMAGEFVMLEELINICFWASVMLPVVICSSVILFSLTYKFLLWMRGKPSKLKWEDNYIQRLSINLGNP